MAKELNQIAAQVAHSIDLERLANSISRGYARDLDKLAVFIRQALLKYDAIDSERLYRKLLKEITQEVKAVTESIGLDAQSQVERIIREEVAFQTAVVSAISSKKPSRPKADPVKKAILKTPLVLNGKAFTFEDRIASYSKVRIDDVKQILLAGWTNGRTTQEMVKQIVGTRTQSGIITGAKRAANGLVRDLVSHSASITKAELAKQNSDIIIGEQAIVTLDSKTSPICQDYGSQDNGGKKWFYKDDGRNFPRPPFHWNCRTVMIFLIAPEYDLEIETTRPAVVNGKAIQVDSKTDWLDLAKRYPKFAEKSIGKTRAKLLDEMSADDFRRVAFDSLGAQRTLEQMVASSKKVAELLRD